MRIPSTISTTTVGRTILGCHRESSAPSVVQRRRGRATEPPPASARPRAGSRARRASASVIDLAPSHGRRAADALTIGEACEIEIDRAPPCSRRPPHRAERARGAPPRVAPEARTRRAPRASHADAGRPGSRGCRIGESPSRSASDSPPSAGRGRRARLSCRRAAPPCPRDRPDPPREAGPPRWSITWTAVVGSFTAGDSARIAMSTMIRTANAGSCSIVRSTPSATIARNCVSAAGSAAPAVDLDQRRACRDEVADRMAKDDEALVRVRPLPEPVHVDRLDRSAALILTTSTGSPGG